MEGADCLAVLCGRDRAPLYIQTSVLGCRPGAVAMKSPPCPPPHSVIPDFGRENLQRWSKQM